MHLVPFRIEDEPCSKYWVLISKVSRLANVPCFVGQFKVTAGFIGKFYIIAAGASSAIWALIITMVVSSVIGLFYYLRIIAAMSGPTEQETARGTVSISFAPGTVLALLTGLLLWFGIYPEPLLRIIRVVLPS